MNLESRPERAEEGQSVGFCAKWRVRSGGGVRMGGREPRGGRGGCKSEHGELTGSESVDVLGCTVVPQSSGSHDETHTSRVSPCSAVLLSRDSSPPTP